MENMGYDQNNPMMANMGYDDNHPATTPGAVSIFKIRFRKKITEESSILGQFTEAF